MLKIKHNLYAFLCGFLDSISLYWVRKILLLTHPVTKKIHPASLELLTTIKNTFIQIFVFMIGLPWIFRYFEQEVMAIILTSLFLPLTYGYVLSNLGTFSSTILMSWHQPKKLHYGQISFLILIFANLMSEKKSNFFIHFQIKSKALFSSSSTTHPSYSLV